MDGGLGALAEVCAREAEKTDLALQARYYSMRRAVAARKIMELKSSIGNVVYHGTVDQEINRNAPRVSHFEELYDSVSLNLLSRMFSCAMSAATYVKDVIMCIARIMDTISPAKKPGYFVAPAGTLNRFKEVYMSL